MTLMIAGGLCAPVTRYPSNKLSFDEWADLYDFMRASGGRRAPSDRNLEDVFNGQADSSKSNNDVKSSADSQISNDVFNSPDSSFGSKGSYYKGGVDLANGESLDKPNTATQLIKVELVKTPDRYLPNSIGTPINYEKAEVTTQSVNAGIKVAVNTNLTVNLLDNNQIRSAIFASSSVTTASPTSAPLTTLSAKVSTDKAEPVRYQEQLYTVFLKVVKDLTKNLEKRVEELHKDVDILNEQNSHQTSSTAATTLKPKDEEVKIRINVEPPLKFETREYPNKEDEKLKNEKAQNDESNDMASTLGITSTSISTLELGTTDVKGTPLSATPRKELTAAESEKERNRYIENSIREQLRNILSGLSTSEQKKSVEEKNNPVKNEGNEIGSESEEGLKNLDRTQNDHLQNDAYAPPEMALLQDHSETTEKDLTSISQKERIRKFINEMWQSFRQAHRREGEKTRSRDSEIFE